MLVLYTILNWFLRLLFGFTENNRSFPSTFSDYNSNNNSDKPWPLFITFFMVILGFSLLLQYLSETKQPNENEEYESLNYDLLEEEQQQKGLGYITIYEQQVSSEWTANNGDGSCCAFCGALSTTRCSRCKIARYCSEGCQIQHWRLVHRNECRETTTLVQERHPNSHEAPIRNPKMEEEEEECNGLEIVAWNSEDSNNNNNNISTCAVCGGSATTRCSRCKAVGYCSARCLIEHWGWHKTECTLEDVDSAQTQSHTTANVRLLKNSYEEDNDHSSQSLALGFYSEGTANIRPLTRGSQEPTRRGQDHTVNGVTCNENEIAKLRNENILLKQELDKWVKRANIAKQRYHNLKAESENELLVLSNEKKRISNAEVQARNAVQSLSQRLQDLQNAVQASFAEKKRQGEYIQKLENKCVELKRELQKAWDYIQELIAGHDERCKAAQIAMKEVEEKQKELQLERERVQLLKDDFCRDVAAAESRAKIAEAEVLDLERKIRSNDKVAVWTDSLGRPAMACAICLTNEKDLAFGCGHMTCRDCGSQLLKCPICRELITSFVKLYPG